MAWGGSWPSAKRQRTKRREVPELDPNDAGFVPEVSLPNFAAAAQRDAARAAVQRYSQLQQPLADAQQQAQQQQLRRTLRPSAAQTAAAAGLQQPPPVPAAERGPEGVLADDEDEADAAQEAAMPATAAASQQGGGMATGTSDTLAALLLLAAQFPAAARAAGLPPIMLKAQVYSIVADRTAVDRDLEQLRLQGAVRIFKLASGAADEYAFMFREEYTAVVRRQQAELAARRTPAPQLAVFDWFLRSVVPACSEVYVPHRQLLALLAQPLPAAAAAATAQAPSSSEHPAGSGPMSAEQRNGDTAAPRRRLLRPVRRQGATAAAATRKAEAPHSTAAPAMRTAAGAAAAERAASSDQAASSVSGGAPSSSNTASGGSAARRPALHGNTAAADAASEQPHKVTDVHVSLLLNAGLLARHASDHGLYLFGVPNTGPLVKSMAKGRAEVLGLVARRRYGELMERDLGDRRLQRSVLDIRFHVRDLIGHGELQRVHTTSGPLLRAVKRN